MIFYFYFLENWVFEDPRDNFLRNEILICIYSFSFLTYLLPPVLEVLHWLCRSLKLYASYMINLPLKGWKLNVYTTLHLIITACNIWNSPSVNSWLWLSKPTLWYLKLRANRLLQNCLKEVPLYIPFTYTGLCCILMDNSSI